MGHPYPTKSGDLDGNRLVNVIDLLIVLGGWGRCADPLDCRADINIDGKVNLKDLMLVLANRR